MRTFALLLLLVVATAAGCRRHVIIHEKDGDVVVIERGHIHSDHCGHFFHGGHWRYCREHVHRAGCGHFFRGGIWVVVD